MSKHEDYNDRTVRASFPILEQTFKKEDPVCRTILAEITDVRDGIVEIKVAPNKYLLIDRSVFDAAVFNHLEDWYE